MKWYHASPTRYVKGDLIQGQSEGWSFKVRCVFMTSDPVPHYTIFDKAREENWFVYEVHPLTKVMIGRCWDEAGAERVEVVRRVGNARGLCNKDKKPKHYRGSQVHWRGKRR